MITMSSKHRNYCKLAASYMRKQPWCDCVTYEMRYGRRGVVDAIGIRSNKTGRSPATAKRRIQAVEVKVSRSDLLQDLRNKKMLKYEKGSSHCVLAIHPDCFAQGATKKDMLAELTKLGLPKYWGVWLLPRRLNVNAVSPLRRATALLSISEARSNYILIRMARSLSARVMDKNV